MHPQNASDFRRERVSRTVLRHLSAARTAQVPALGNASRINIDELVRPDIVKSQPFKSIVKAL
jgi:hypothetical protein